MTDKTNQQMLHTYSTPSDFLQMGKKMKKRKREGSGHLADPTETKKLKKVKEEKL